MFPGPAFRWRDPEANRPRVTAKTSPLVMDVLELTEVIAGALSREPQLKSFWVRGEVANLTRAASGHYYFTLKDEVAQIKAVLFRTNAARAAIQPEPGVSVVAHGQVNFYERTGQVQIVVNLLFPEGMGMAQLQHEALYRRLESDGLFAEGRKRKLPAFPRRIGIVSSESGAVIHDLLTVLKRRYPFGHIVFAPTRVQGEGAASDIAASLQTIGDWRSPEDGLGVDVIVLARGGGSAEDLSAFNEEQVVRAIFASPKPVVSAVGHETDVTLADLVADLRAATPSAAAELISPDIPSLARDVANLRLRGRRIVVSRLTSARDNTTAARERLRSRMVTRVKGMRDAVESRRLQLRALSPLATLDRGYAVAEYSDGVVTDAAQLAPGQQLRVRLRRGRVDSTVDAVHVDPA